MESSGPIGTSLVMNCEKEGDLDIRVPFFDLAVQLFFGGSMLGTLHACPCETTPHTMNHN